MTAGTASTHSTTAPNDPSQTGDTTLPYQPRPLTRGERNRRLTHVFYSVRNHRIVTVTEAINAAAAMMFEFDPSLEVYVERPRRLQLSPRQQIDIAFWTRTREGQERFYVTVPEAGTIGSTSGTVSVRDPSVLAEVAQRHEMTLHILTEAQLRSQSAWLKTCNELMLHLWEYTRQPARSVIRHHIEGRLAQASRISLSGLVPTLDYTHTAIKAVVAAMIHDGSLRLVEYTPGMIDAVLEVGGA